MLDAGRIKLELAWNGRSIVRAAVRSRRPQIAARLLRGQAPEAAAKRLPTVFSLCAQAQGLAGQLALGAATGVAPGAAEVARRRLAVAAENVHESLWRLLKDWPEWLGETPALPSIVALRRALAPLATSTSPDDDARDAAAACAAVVEAAVLGEPLADWRARDAVGRAAWAAQGSTVAARLIAAAAVFPEASAPRQLPEVSAAGLIEVLGEAIDKPEFAALPVWKGAPAETGAARWLTAAGGVAARLLARLDEAVAAIAALGEGLRPSADAARDGAGRGWSVVATARGRLLHVATVSGGTVADYCIIAPTEWNFHPQGALPELLVGAPAATRDAAARLGVLAIQALDPCVNHQVEVIDA